MEPDPIGHAVDLGLVVGEPDLVLGDRHPVDPAAEAPVGHEAGPAPARAAVEEPVVGGDQAQVVEQQVGLGGLQAVHLLDDRLVPVVGRRGEHRRVDGTEPVVVVVEAVDLAEGQVHLVVTAVVPPGCDVALVVGEHDGIGGGVLGHGLLLVEISTFSSAPSALGTSTATEW